MPRSKMMSAPRLIVSTKQPNAAHLKCMRAALARVSRRDDKILTWVKVWRGACVFAIRMTPVTHQRVVEAARRAVWVG